MRLRCRVSRLPLVACFAIAVSLTAGCSGGSSSALVASPAGRVPFEHHASGRIQHVVIIVQENESFDHFFNGYPGADTVQSGPLHTGVVIPLAIQNLGDATNTSHYASDFLADYNAGKLNGFDLNTNSPSPNLLPYTYVDQSQLGPYWQMAGQYVLADKYFTSHIDASFIGHQYLIAAQANHAVNLPTGLWGCPGGPSDVIPTLNSDRTIGQMEPVCMDYQTLGDELDAAGLTWRFYTPLNSSWSAYQAVSHIYNGPDWTNVISPETQILSDIPNGVLSNVTWVVPIYCNSPTIPVRAPVRCPQPAWAAVGRQHRQRRRPEPVLGQHRDFGYLGRMGRRIRSRQAAEERLRRRRLPGAAPVHLGLRLSGKVKVNHGARDRRHPAFCGADVRPGEPLRGRQAGQVGGQRLHQSPANRAAPVPAEHLVAITKQLSQLPKAQTHQSAATIRNASAPPPQFGDPMTKRLRLTHLIPAGLLAAIAATASGCGGNVSPPLPTTHNGTVSSIVPPKGSKFQHIVIIVQENQSFDHLFNGYPGADTAQSGPIHTGATVPLAMHDIKDPTATSHYSVDFLMDYNGGKMNGFDLNTNAPGPALGAYSYVNPAEIQPYLQMAQQYVLADKHFASHIDASLVAHQYIVAAQANSAVNLPTGSWGCEGAAGDLIPTLGQDRSITGLVQPPCFTYKNMADELDAAALSWRFYAACLTCSGGGYSSFQADSDIYNSPEWSTNVINEPPQIITDIQNGTLSSVTWVTPEDDYSDHPGSNDGSGPSWVASIVNAIGESKFWNSTEIFVTWDEWGGEYDHVPPPYKDYDGLGFRVPMLYISPFAYQGKVNHKQLEIAGMLKAVEKNFGLASMAAADKRAAASDSGCINNQQKSPRTFTPISSSLGPRRYFLHIIRPCTRALTTMTHSRNGEFHDPLTTHASPCGYRRLASTSRRLLRKLNDRHALAAAGDALRRCSCGNVDRRRAAQPADRRNVASRREFPVPAECSGAQRVAFARHQFKQRHAVRCGLRAVAHRGIRRIRRSSDAARRPQQFVHEEPVGDVRRRKRDALRRRLELQQRTRVPAWGQRTRFTPLAGPVLAPIDVTTDHEGNVCTS